MANDIFHRKEIKYLITTQQKDSILPLLHTHMQSDKYNQNNKPYTICNLYLDSPCNELIIRSLEKPEYKEKIRLRSYGKVLENDNVFLESKKKINNIVYKRRSVCTLKEANNFLSSNIFPNNSKSNLQVLKEIQNTIKLYNLSPKVFISYERFAFFEVNNFDFRVTIDTNIQARRNNLDLQIEPSGTQLLSKDMWLMEAKAIKAFPLWFVNHLSENKIYSSSFSKYGTEYKNYIGDLHE